MNTLITATEILAALYIAALFVSFILTHAPQAASPALQPAPVAPAPTPRTQPLRGSSQPAYVITIPVAAEVVQDTTERLSREEMKAFPGVRQLRKEGTAAGIKGAARMDKTTLLKALGYL